MHLRLQKSYVLAMCERAVRSSSREEVIAIKAQYGKKQKTYHFKSSDSEVTSSYSELKYPKFTSLEGKSQMSASFSKNKSSVESQKNSTIDVQINGFLKRKQFARRWEHPEPPLTIIRKS